MQPDVPDVVLLGEHDINQDCDCDGDQDICNARPQTVSNKSNVTLLSNAFGKMVQLFSLILCDLEVMMLI